MPKPPPRDPTGSSFRPGKSDTVEVKQRESQSAQDKNMRQKLITEMQKHQSNLEKISAETSQFIDRISRGQTKLLSQLERKINTWIRLDQQLEKVAQKSMSLPAGHRFAPSQTFRSREEQQFKAAINTILHHGRGGELFFDKGVIAGLEQMNRPGSHPGYRRTTPSGGRFGPVAGGGIGIYARDQYIEAFKQAEKDYNAGVTGRKQIFRGFTPEGGLPPGSSSLDYARAASRAGFSMYAGGAEQQAALKRNWMLKNDIWKLGDERNLRGLQTGGTPIGRPGVQQAAEAADKTIGAFYRAIEADATAAASKNVPNIARKLGGGNIGGGGGPAASGGGLGALFGGIIGASLGGRGGWRLGAGIFGGAGGGPGGPPPSGGGGGGGLLGAATGFTEFEAAKKAVLFIHAKYTEGEDNLRKAFQASRFVASGGMGRPTGAIGGFADVLGNIFQSPEALTRSVPFKDAKGRMKWRQETIGKAGDLALIQKLRTAGITPDMTMDFMRQYQLNPEQGLWGALQTAGAAALSPELGFLGVSGYGAQMSRMRTFGYGKGGEETQRRIFGGAINALQDMPKEQTWNNLTESIDLMNRNSSVLANFADTVGRFTGMMKFGGTPAVRSGEAIMSAVSADRAAGKGIIQNPYLFSIAMSQNKDWSFKGTARYISQLEGKGAGTTWMADVRRSMPGLEAALNDPRVPIQQKFALLQKGGALPQMMNEDILRKQLGGRGAAGALAAMGIMPGMEEYVMADFFGARGRKAGKLAPPSSSVYDDIGKNVMGDLNQRMVDADTSLKEVKNILTSMLHLQEKDLMESGKKSADRLDKIWNFLQEIRNSVMNSGVHSGGGGGLPSGVTHSGYHFRHPAHHTTMTT